MRISIRNVGRVLSAIAIGFIITGFCLLFSKYNHLLESVIFLSSGLLSLAIINCSSFINFTLRICGCLKYENSSSTIQSIPLTPVTVQNFIKHPTKEVNPTNYQTLQENSNNSPVESHELSIN